MPIPFDKTIIALHGAASGGIINNAEIAIKIAELILENNQGREELELQKPLIAEDRGDGWFVHGSYNHDKKKMGKASWHIYIRKSDAQVTSMFHDYRFPDPPEDVKSIIRAHQSTNLPKEPS